MLNKRFIQKLKKEYDQHDSERRQIISLSNVVLHDSKRVIFSLHRGNPDNAGKKLVEIESILKKLNKKFGFERIIKEGSYRAGVEEYVEAKTFYQVMAGKKIDTIKELKLSFDSYLGGICDLTGELVRVAINQSAAGNYEEVVKIKKIISDIMSELVQFDMTGYMRTKYDQARSSLRKIEQINYEIKLKSK